MNKPQEHLPFITGFDLKRLLLKYRIQVVRSALFFMGCVLCAFLSLEPKYTALASFQQSAKQSDIPLKIKEMFQQFSSTPTEVSAMAVMQSNAVLKKTVEELGLQGKVKMEGVVAFLFRNVYENILLLLGKNLSDRDAFVLRDIRYHQETPLLLYLQPTGSDAYQILTADKKLVGHGQVGRPFSFGSLQMTVARMPKGVVTGRAYLVKIVPWQDAVKKFCAKLSVKKGQIDSNLLNLTFRDRDRHIAAAFLNHLMVNYQYYLKLDNEEICQAQLRYLEKRQDELTGRLDHALMEHVAYLEANLAEDGHVGLTQELESLSLPRDDYLAKRLDVDLRIKRLEPLPLTADDKSKKQQMPGSELHAKLRENGLDARRIEKGAVEPLGEIDFVGLDLHSAKQFWTEYTSKRDACQAQLRELVFLRERLNDPEYELSSTGAVYSDGVTNELLHKASAIALQLEDDQNRSQRDQQRLMEALQTQKKFLSQHLLQTIELTKLRSRLLEDKIEGLRQATISLLHTEKDLLDEKLDEINDKMKGIPEKWRRENLLLLKRELGMRMIEGMTQLAESKNISQHLYQVSSKTLDAATPPLKPKSFSIGLLLLLAGLAGSGGAYAFYFCKMLVNGVPVSVQQLKALGFPIAGALSRYCQTQLPEICEEDLETLRNLSDGILSCQIPNQCVAVIGGRHPDFTRPLAELIAMQGVKVAVVHFVFDALVRPDDRPGLWQYLNGEITDIPLRPNGSYDFISSGGTSRYSVEWLSSPKFLEMIRFLKERYAVVLVYSSANPTKAEGRALLKIADTAIVSVQQETKEDLAVYCDWTENQAKARASFVYHCETGKK